MAADYESLVQQATARAASDSEYHSRLQSDPKAALQELTDAPLPGSLIVNAGTGPTNADGTLDVDELEAVSGGAMSSVGVNAECINILWCSAVGV